MLKFLEIYTYDMATAKIAFLRKNRTCDLN